MFCKCTFILSFFIFKKNPGLTCKEEELDRVLKNLDEATSPYRVEINTERKKQAKTNNDEL